MPEFAKLRSQLLDVFIISSDFDLAQHFSCSVKTVECGQLFILACGQLQKKAQFFFYWTILKFIESTYYQGVTLTFCITRPAGLVTLVYH